MESKRIAAELAELTSNLSVSQSVKIAVLADAYAKAYLTEHTTEVGSTTESEKGQ